MTPEDFLTKKGLDLDHFVIHDISGHYKAPIPIHIWLAEFAQQANNCTCPPETTTGWTMEKLCNDCGLITNKNNRFCDNCEKMVEPLSLGDACPNCACDI
jgi:hypothetical protein